MRHFEAGSMFAMNHTGESGDGERRDYQWDADVRQFTVLKTDVYVFSRRYLVCQDCGIKAHPAQAVRDMYFPVDDDCTCRECHGGAYLEWIATEKKTAFVSHQDAL